MSVCVKFVGDFCAVFFGKGCFFLLFIFLFVIIFGEVRDSLMFREICVYYFLPVCVCVCVCMCVCVCVCVCVIFNGP